MRLELEDEDPADLTAYAEISIAFTIDRVLLPVPERGPLAFREVAAREVVRKDYDAEPGAHPAAWSSRFDTSAWRIVSALRGGRRVGGMALIQGTPEIDMLEGRTDLALVWDLRVAPDARGTGVGRALLSEAERWAATRGCTELKVETQNVNVGACRFYERMGFRLRSVDPSAYPGLPDEIQMLWYKRL